MKVLIVGATGSIGRHVVETSTKMGHQTIALVRSQQKSKLLPRDVEIIYGDVSVQETLTGIGDNINAVIFTLGSDGLGRIGARAIDYGGVKNILKQSCGSVKGMDISLPSTTNDIEQLRTLALPWCKKSCLRMQREKNFNNASVCRKKR